VPVALAIAGIDFLVARNTVAAVVPAAVCLGAGYAAGRLGLVAATALCLLGAAISLAPALDTTYGRTDWRAAGEALRDPRTSRAIVVTPFMSRSLWRPYLRGLDEPGPGGAVVQEVASVGLATEGGYSAGGITPPAVGSPRPLEGFRVVAVDRKPTYTLVLYRADRPRRVSLDALSALALADEQPGILVQPG
jgi:hypothetical protein